MLLKWQDFILKFMEKSNTPLCMCVIVCEWVFVSVLSGLGSIETDRIKHCQFLFFKFSVSNYVFPQKWMPFNLCGLTGSDCGETNTFLLTDDTF